MSLLFQPGIAPSLSPGARKWAGVKAAMEVRRQMRQSQSVGAKKIDLPEEDPNASDRTAFIFYSDEGGYRATNEVDGEMQVVYYLGVIDILTPYNLLKKVEHIWKGLRDDKVRLGLRAYPEEDVDYLPSQFSTRFPLCHPTSMAIGSSRSCRM